MSHTPSAPRRRTRAAAVATIAVLAAALAACTAAGMPSAGTTAPPSPSSSTAQVTVPPIETSTAAGTTSQPAPSTTSPPAAIPTSTASSSTRTPEPEPPTRAEEVLAGMTLEQRVGQLIMGPVPAPGPADVSLVTDLHLGAVILTGRSQRSVADTAAITARLQAAAAEESPAGLLVAADQEGGAVQVFQGPGFTRMPSAVRQAADFDPAGLAQKAEGWGSELAAAGINLNLAPVLDTVDDAFAPRNAPIGYWDRQYGSDPQQVADYGLAFAAGMRAAGVAASVKHFPGLGRVTGNTDTARGVIDEQVDADAPDLAPFAAAVEDGAETVMVASAVYRLIDDTEPAVFSAAVIDGLLRGGLGFDGVVITDDIGAAEQVAGIPVGERAVRFLQAGGDIALSVDAGAARTMYDAVLAAARSDEALADRVAVSAGRVLALKERMGLLD